MKTARIWPGTEWKEPKQTDDIGACFIDSKKHYFRQDKGRVLHVAKGIINTLDANHIESMRENWGDKFDKITIEDFNDYMQVQLNSFFE